MTKYEPNSFWYFTTGAIIMFGIIIVILAWFLYIGHEPYEPVHDENPHASILQFKPKSIA